MTKNIFILSCIFSSRITHNVHLSNARYYHCPYHHHF